MRSLADAQHEAAHVVVGVALGLRLYRVSLAPAKPVRKGGIAEVTWYAPMPREADLIMTAAGVAWERRVGDLEWAAFDLADLRRAGVRGNARLRALEIAAWAILYERSDAHTRVTRALLERDLTARDVTALARGERTAGA